MLVGVDVRHMLNKITKILTSSYTAYIAFSADTFETVYTVLYTSATILHFTIL